MLLHPTGAFKINKDAASRFIKAGTHNKASAPSASSSFYTSKATVSDPREIENQNNGPGVHSRLSSLGRNAAGKGKKPEEADSDSSSSSGEESDLQVHNNQEGAAASPANGTVKGKKRKWNSEGVIEEETPNETVAAGDVSKKASQDPLHGALFRPTCKTATPDCGHRTRADPLFLPRL